MNKYLMPLLLSCVLLHQSADGAKTTSKGAVMKGFIGDIEDLTEKNPNFRKVLYTGKKLQLVLMSLRPGEEIGEETHADRDQFFRIEKGKGEVFIDGKKTDVKADDVVIVPAGAKHNLINTDKGDLKLYTLYGPPEHADGTIHKSKSDSEASAEHFDGRTTEP